MSNAQNFRFKCRNPRCGYEELRRYSLEEFDKLQYGSLMGISCFKCGFPRMATMRSMQTVKDGFKPGFQRNIGKHCGTYAEYKAHLKKMGLIEIGYEDLPENENETINYWDDKTIKAAIDSGVYLSGRETEALKQGKLNEM